MKKIIITNKAPKAIGPYSQAIVANNFVFISGQIHLTPDGELVSGSASKKTDQVMKNLLAVLKASGVSFKNVVKTTIYLTDMSMFAEVNNMYESYIEEPYPARETVAVKELPKGANIEISMIAVKN